VAFAVAGGGGSRLWTMGPDGTDPAELAGQPTGSNTDSATSPDGTKIAFTSDHSGNADIWVLDLVGSSSTQLTTDTGADSAPAWSADGNTIAFQSDRSGNMDVWLMNPDGSSETQLTHNTASDSQPAWFPKSRRIAFQSNRMGQSDIFAVNANGTSIKRLTTSTAPDTQPSVNPAGTLVAFTSRRSNNTDIYTVPVAGGTNTRVSSNTAVDSQPAFSTDGRYLSFTSTRSGIAQVWRVPRPSGSSIQLTNGTDPAGASDWLPYAYPTPSWAARFNAGFKEDDVPFAMTRSPDGSKVFSAGNTFNSIGKPVAGLITAYDSDGTEAWTKRVDIHSPTILNAIAISPDGSTLYVAGSSFLSLFVAAYDADNGAVLFTRSYDFGSRAIAWALVVSPDGTKAYVAGTDYNASGYPAESLTLALNAPSLTSIWQQTISKGDPTEGAIALNASGSTLFWAGVHYGTPVSDYTQWDYLTTAYRTSDGNLNWSQAYDSSVSDEDVPGALGVSPDGSKVFVTGFSYGGSSRFDQATVAYGAASGTQAWVNRWDSPNHGWDWGDTLAVSPDGSTVYTGGARSRTVSSKLTYDGLTTSIAAGNGALNWANMYNGPGDYTKTDSGDQINDVQVAPDSSRVYATGNSFRTLESFDMTSLAFDQAGNRVWLARYDAGSADYGYDAVLSPDGSTLFATGPSFGVTHYSVATVAWDVNGCGPCQALRNSPSSKARQAHSLPSRSIGKSTRRGVSISGAAVRRLGV
jgi:Tol biopolymer transport system component